MQRHIGVHLSEREMGEVEAADEVAFRSPVPTQMVSNCEYNPIPQTEDQRKVESLIKSKAEKGLGAAAVRGFSETLEELGAVKLGPPVHFLQEVKTPAEKSHVETTSIEAPINI
jgi:hypothetical protein